MKFALLIIVLFLSCGCTRLEASNQNPVDASVASETKSSITIAKQSSENIFCKSSSDIADQVCKNSSPHYEIIVPSEWKIGRFESIYGTVGQAFIIPGISVKNFHVFNSVPSCESENTGMSAPQNLLNVGNNTVWGKIDDMQFGWDKPFPNALCDPNISCSGLGAEEKTCIKNSTTYAFCSERNNERVLFCFFQGKDDPELAEKIFSTFKWLN